MTLDRDWRITYVNPRGAEILLPLQKTSSSFLGKVFWEAFPGTVGNVFEESYRRAAREQATVAFEAFYPPLRRWFDIRAYPSRAGLSIYFLDVSERKEAEAERDRLAEASDQQRRLYETALSATPDFQYTFDLDGRFRFVNQALLDLWQKPLADVVGRTFFDLGYPPDLAARLHRQVREVVETRRPVRDETAYASHLGERDYEYIFTPVLRADGTVEAVAGSTRDVTERTRAEAERARFAAESERQFRTMAESIPQLAWMANPDGHIFWYNRRWYEYTGTTFEQMEGWGWQAVHDPAMLPGVMVRWQESIATGQPFDMVFPLKGADGAFRPFLTRVVPFADEHGRVTRWIGTNTDISEVKRVEDRLRESEARKSAMVETSLDGIITIDRDGKVLEFNPAAERTFGYRREDALGREMAELIIPPALRDGHRKGLAWYLETGEGPILGRRLELTAVRAGGGEFPVEVAITRINADGPPLFTGYVRDISDRKRAEAALRENERRFRTLVEQVADYAIFTTDPDGRPTSWNEGVSRVLGFAEAEFLGRDVVPLIFTPEDLAAGAVAQELAEAAATGRAGNDRWMRRKDGTRFFALGVTTGLRDGDGGLLGYMKVMRDLTERKRMEDDLRQVAAELSEADRRKDEFLATLAHELRNPLAPIRNGLQILKLVGPTAPPTENARAMMERQVASWCGWWTTCST